MDGGIGVASGITALITIVAQITRLSYNYAVDVRSAARVQKTYFQEVKALKDVLDRLLQALDDSAQPRPESLSDSPVDECREQLESQKLRLEKGVKKLVWPFQERDIRQTIDNITRFRSILADCTIALVL